MPIEEVGFAAEVILLKLHVITGWAIPEREFMNILVDQFKKKLIESYPNVNIDEIEFAFRNNPGVKDWGKNMNLNLIDEVMTPYLQKRFELSRIEETKARPQLEAPEISDDEFIEAVYQAWITADKDYGIIPELAYETLNLNLTRDQKLQIKADVDSIHTETPMQDRVILYKQVSVARYFETLKK